MTRVAFFGGTFDPVHLGHLLPALHALEIFDFDAVHFVPAADPPHKQGERLTPFALRVAMVALATQGHPRLFVTGIEGERAGPSYTIDTLRAVRARFPAEQAYFLLGSDSFAQIKTWHRWRDLVDLVHLVVLHRDTVWGDDLVAAAPDELASRIVAVDATGPRPVPDPGRPQIYLLAHPPVRVSATAVRERLRRGEGADDLVPKEVAAFVRKYRLYDQEDGPIDAR